MATAQLCYTLFGAWLACRWPRRLHRLSERRGRGLAAERMAAEGRTVTAQELCPVYLRLSQAERERLAKGLPITLEDQ